MLSCMITGVHIVCAKITLWGSHCINDTFLAGQVSAVDSHTCVYINTQVPAPQTTCKHKWCSHSCNQQVRIHYKQHTSQSKTVQSNRRQMSCLRATWHCALELQPQSCKLGEETRTTGYVQRRSSLYHTLQFHYSQHLCACSPVCVLDQAMQDIAMQKACTGDSGYWKSRQK